MKARRVLAIIVGMTQSAIGLLAFVLVGILYFDFLNIQTTLNVTAELLPLSLLILSVFGLFSVISGFFLIHED